MPAIDWDSPQMREIEAEWRSLRGAYTKDRPSRGDDVPGRYMKYVGSVERLFQTRFSPRRLRELAASSKMPILADDEGGFANDLLAFMVKAFVQTGDREGLLELLSKRCPSRIDGPETLEYCLTYRGWRLKDPMLVLGEAYARSRVPETRHALAASVRRGFAGLGIRGKDDREFVGNAMRWYEKEKGHLVVNAKYPMNETMPGGITLIDSYEKNPDLFDNPPQAREPLFKERIVPPGGPKNLGEDPDR